jgi:hypothetical protein
MTKYGVQPEQLTKEATIDGDEQEALAADRKKEKQAPKKSEQKPEDKKDNG